MSTDYQTPQAHDWSAKVAGFDGHVFITAEYNRGITAALKSAIDYLYPEWNDKAAGIVTYGSSGGGMTGAALRDVLSTVQVAVVTNQPAFNLFTDFKNMTVIDPSPVHNGAIDSMLAQVEKWAAALATTRLAVAASRRYETSRRFTLTTRRLGQVGVKATRVVHGAAGDDQAHAIVPNRMS